MKATSVGHCPLSSRLKLKLSTLKLSSSRRIPNAARCAARCRCRVGQHPQLRFFILEPRDFGSLELSILLPAPLRVRVFVIRCWTQNSSKILRIFLPQDALEPWRR